MLWASASFACLCPAHFQCFQISQKGHFLLHLWRAFGTSHWLMTLPRLSEAIIKMICQAAMVYKQTRSKFALTFFTFYLFICGVHATTTCMEVRGQFLRVSVPHPLTNRGCQAWLQAPSPTEAACQPQKCFLMSQTAHRRRYVFNKKMCWMLQIPLLCLAQKCTSFRKAKTPVETETS